MLRAHHFSKDLAGSWWASLKVNGGLIKLLYQPYKQAKTSRITVLNIDPETVPLLCLHHSLESQLTALKSTLPHILKRPGLLALPINLKRYTNQLFNICRFVSHPVLLISASLLQLCQQLVPTATQSKWQQTCVGCKRIDCNWWHQDCYDLKNKWQRNVLEQKWLNCINEYVLITSISRSPKRPLVFL